MIEKEIDKIHETDLKTLIDDEVAEGRSIEYKESLPSNADKDKKEFLADVSSFANSIGGDLIIGIVEKKGIPTEIKGVEVDDVDKEKLRLEQMIRNGISPKIPSIAIKVIKLSNSNFAFLIRIPQSWISPHRVIYSGHDKFYSRNSSGKYPLDVDELRIAFNLSETTREKIINFRVDRISKILSNETPVPLAENPKIILHMIPLASFSRPQSYEIKRVSSNPVINLSPISGNAHYWRLNFDGFITYSSVADKTSRSYLQLFRNGIIEVVEAGLIRHHNGKLLIPSVTFEEEIIKSFSRYLNSMRILNIALPIFIYLTLIGVKGYSMATRRGFVFSDEEYAHKIDKDILMVPELIVESFDIKAELALKPCFDTVWNASGYEGSQNYNENDEWKPYRE